MSTKKITKITYHPDGALASMEITEYEFEEPVGSYDWQFPEYRKPTYPDFPPKDGYIISYSPNKPGPTQVNTAWLKEKIDAVHDAVYEGERDCD